MVNRAAPIRQTEATRLLKAAKAAGFARTRLIAHPDGRLEVIGDDSPGAPVESAMGHFERWKAENAHKD